MLTDIIIKQKTKSLWQKKKFKKKAKNEELYKEFAPNWGPFCNMSNVRPGMLLNKLSRLQINRWRSVKFFIKRLIGDSSSFFLFFLQVSRACKTRGYLELTCLRADSFQGVCYPGNWISVTLKLLSETQNPDVSLKSQQIDPELLLLVAF